MNLPDRVVVQRTAISPTSYEYTFCHDELGELGSVLFCAGCDGSMHLMRQVRRVHGDASMEQRRALFDPIAATVETLVGAMQKNGPTTP